MNKPIKKTFLAVSAGEWASSKVSFVEAMNKLPRVPRSDKTHLLYLVLNDDTAEVDNSGCIVRDAGSELVQVAKFNSRPKLFEFIT